MVCSSEAASSLSIVALCNRLLPPIYLALSLTAMVSRTAPLLKKLSEHGKTMTSQYDRNKFPWIPKRSFRHFYTTGVIWMILVIALFGDCSPASVKTTMMIHLLRRLYECTYVHKFTPSSKMHFASWLLGIGHYLLLPFNFVGNGNATKPILSGLSVVANLWLQYEQYRHHVLLSKLRNFDRMASRMVPQKGWFRLVLCPHYLAEVSIYFTWALMMPIHEIHDSNFGCWFLFLWVGTNLTISSLNNYDWYKRQYPNLSQSALIPCVL